MIILSDIVLDFGDTSGEILIDGLAHYWDLDADSMRPLAMYLRESNAAVVPRVILLDHSDEKKDSVLLPLKTYCGKISNSMRFSVNHHDLFLVSSIDKCLLETYLQPIESNFVLSCSADFVTHNYLIPAKCETLVLETNLSQNIITEVDIFPLSCRLKELDNKFLYELDPFLLPELDWYGIGARLVSEATIQRQVLVDVKEQNNQLQTSMIDIEVSPPVSYYDDYLLMDLDGYTLGELDRKI